MIDYPGPFEPHYSRRSVLAAASMMGLIGANAWPAGGTTRVDAPNSTMLNSPGWDVRRLTPPSPLRGSNGLQFGPAGKLYIAEMWGCSIAALDLRNDSLTTVCGPSDPIISPDDLAFDSAGNMYITEVYENRISRFTPAGVTEVIYDGMESINGITIHRDRIFVDECRPNGVLQEIFADSRPPRLIADKLPLPNSPAVGPDGAIYFPVFGLGEIWKVASEGGAPQKVCGGLERPSGVKFDRNGMLYACCAQSGRVVRVDIRNGMITTIATVAPGIDNLAVNNDGRIYLSSLIEGGICEVNGNSDTQMRVRRGFTGPFGIASGADGTLYVADGFSIAAVARTGEVSRISWILQHGYPGFVRCIAALPDGRLAISTAEGTLLGYDPQSGVMAILAEGLNDAHGIAVAPDGAIITAEAGAGRIMRYYQGRASILASGLARPIDVQFDKRGTLFVSENGAGRIVSINRSSRAVISGLNAPEGFTCVDDSVVVADVGTRALIQASISGEQRQVLLKNAPIGLASRGTPKQVVIRSGRLRGPKTPFAGVTSDRNGTIYVTANSEGSILAITRDRRA